MAALEKIPTEYELASMIGDGGLAAWKRLCGEIDALYDMDTAWNDGGKRWTYEYKYRRGGKTLCALYAAPGRFGLMLIFGAEERQRFETLRSILSPSTLRDYDEAATYHDGKWVMFSQDLPSEDLRAMLALKRRPNRIHR